MKIFLDNKDLSETYGPNARKIVENNFSTIRINTQILKIYNDFLNT